MKLFPQFQKSLYSRILKLASPIILGQLGNIFTSLADSAMVGQLGAVELAAVSFAHSLWMAVVTFGMGAIFGLTPLIAHADGSKNPLEIRLLLKNSLVYGLIVGLFLTLAMSILLLTLGNFGQEARVVSLTRPYFLLLTLSMIPTAYTFVFKQFAEGLALTRVAMYIVLSGNLLNIILNYFLVFGKGGFPMLGVEGAGWATLVARCFMFLCFAFYILGHARFKQFRPSFNTRYLSFSKIREISKLGLPIGFQYIFEAGAFSVSAIMMGWISAETLAAHQIALMLSAVTYMISGGISSALMVLTGNAYGRLDFVQVKAVADKGLTLSLLVMGAWAVVFIVFNESLPRLFTTDTAVIDIASGLLVITAIFQLSDGVQICSHGLLRGIRDVRFPALITFISYWVFALPVGYMLSVYVYGAVGIWVGLLIGLTLTAIMLVARFYIKLSQLSGGKE